MKNKTISRPSANRCAFCHSSEGIIGLCNQCGASHHFECFEENRGKCAACHTRYSPSLAVRQFDKPSELTPEEALHQDYLKVCEEAQQLRQQMFVQNIVIGQQPQTRVVYRDKPDEAFETFLGLLGVFGFVLVVIGLVS